MMRLIRKRKVFVLAAVFVGPLVLLSVCFLPLSSEETAFEVASPEGRYVAWVAVKDFGLGYDTRVSVRDLEEADESGHAPRRRLVSIAGKVSSQLYLDLIWQDETTLIIEYFYGAKVYGVQDQLWHDLNIVLREKERRINPPRR